MRYETKIKSLAIGAAFAALSLTSLESFACGESLFRVGKGVAYRAQTAPLPGNVLVVAPDQAAKRLAVRLAAAGHHVEVVESASMLAEKLSGGEIEVVLAPFNDRELVAAQTASAASSATFVPVALEASEEVQAEHMYDRSLAASDSFTDFLKVIHQTLKSRA
jgi:hypothetical protein